VKSLIKAFALPPASLLLLIFAGLYLRQRGVRGGGCIAIAALVSLYVLATPLFGTLALRSLEPPYTDPVAAEDVQAIVVLGGGTAGPAPEYGTDAVNALTLIRLRYAAYLQRKTGKPLLVSGGSNGETSPEARQMQAVLTREFQVPVRWLEERSVDTYTNALETHRVLSPLNINKVYLVTHAWHMPRARLAFEHAGFRVVAAPTAFTHVDPGDIGPGDFVPRASALLNSYYFCHELLGYAVYKLRMHVSASFGGEGNASSREMG
jgi:uncharacterized SAM-binding protein YcdF (DUF218 family)